VAKVSGTVGFGAQAPEAHDTPLFPSASGEVPAKAEVIRAWSRLSDPPAEVKGHTPRRSGAKRYARAGWAVQCIQHLGRWAGSTVLEYIEEAYAELPLEAAAACRRGEDSAIPDLTARIKSVEQVCRKLQVTLSASSIGAASAAVSFCEKVSDPTPLKWVSGPTAVHRVATFSKEVPRHAWRTNCGWKFASAGHFVILDEEDIVPGVAFCKKCPPPVRTELLPACLSDAAEARLDVS